MAMSAKAMPAKGKAKKEDKMTSKKKSMPKMKKK